MHQFVSRFFAPLVFLLTATAGYGQSLTLEKGDHVCLIGNTLAERMQWYGYFETLLHGQFPQHQLVVRNLGWSADELKLRPRSLDFGTADEHLTRQQADVALLFFGFNESFAGPAGLEQFKKDLDETVRHMLAQKYNGRSAPRLALVSPIAAEDIGDPNVPDGKATSENLALYTQAMQEVAAQHKIAFVDCFTPTRKRMEESEERLTINSIHLNDAGYRALAPILMSGLFGGSQNGAPSEDLRAAVNEKNLQFWYRHRAVNGYYIYGGRKEPFGTKSFPQEFEKLDQMIANRDRRVWDIAQGKTVPATIDDSNTRKLDPIPTNYEQPIKILAPEGAIGTFKLPQGYQINAFATEVDFDLQNPVALNFDAQGRMWVATMPSYPQYLPGSPPNDKLLILEDTDGDGKADKQTVFADGLHLPTGFEFGDGGVYVAQQPNLVFLKDTNGDDRADVREIVLHGFDTADSHHSISAFTWSPGGVLHFEEGTFHHTQVESPYGPVRVKDAAVFGWEPRRQKLEVFVSYGFANPWGHIYDRWGQNFVADASPGANYFGTAFSGHVDYPRKHKPMKQFIVKRVRPTCGCEIVSSRHFPDEAQGNFLLNNCIGFQGVLQHKMTEEGSGFVGVEIEPLLQSSDPNFRPVDLKFGPDGALYVVDWFNPLIGHMQHSLRDPNRDNKHGRVWRITYQDHPLLTPPKIAGEPIPALLELLKAYEDRTRYAARRELHDRDTTAVVGELEKWTTGLNQNDKDYEHHLLEALWVYQHHNVVNETLLKRLLNAKDYRARAAATRVLCYWRDQVSEPLALLKERANDEHPRVRLEAVRACSFFTTPAAAEVALESLNHPQDEYLEYTLEETIETLKKYLEQG